MIPREDRIDPRYAGKAVMLLNACGYRTNQKLLLESPLRAIASLLEPASRRRQKTVLELIELAEDDAAGA